MSSLVQFASGFSLLGGFVYIFVLCSGSLKYYGVSTSWNVIETHVNCTGICSSYLNLQEKPFLIFRDGFFRLRNSPSVNSSAVGKEPWQDLLKHPSPKINKICVSKWKCGSEIMKQAQESFVPLLRSWLKCRIIQTSVEWQSYLGLWGGVGLSS